MNQKIIDYYIFVRPYIYIPCAIISCNQYHKRGTVTDNHCISTIVIIDFQTQYSRRVDDYSFQLNHPMVVREDDNYSSPPISSHYSSLPFTPKWWQLYRKRSKEIALFTRPHHPVKYRIRVRHRYMLYLEGCIRSSDSISQSASFPSCVASSSSFL